MKPSDRDRRAPAPATTGAPPAGPTRRQFLGGLTIALAGAALGPTLLEPKTPARPPRWIGHC